MPNGSENWNTAEWLRHLDRKLDQIHAKLSAKADKVDLIRAENRLYVVEEKTTRLVTLRDGIWAGLLAVSHVIAKAIGSHG